MALPTTRIENVMYHTLTDLTGIGERLAEKIRRKLGYNVEGIDPDQYALERIGKDPYILIEVEGIGFKRADTVALNDFSVSPDHPERHWYGNREALREKGCLDPPDYRQKRSQLGLRNPELEFEGVRVDGNLIWLPEELEAEKTVARWTADVLLTHRFGFPELEEEQHSIIQQDSLNADQAEAVITALRADRLMILTGAAGTGKTKTIATIAKCALIEKRTMIVLTFAGKAADRAAEAMRDAGADVDCSTIHRALKHNGREFTLDELGADIVVIDESSMIPNLLLAAVLERLPEHATLIMVGDNAQLPPIGHGFPFADIITAGALRINLEQNYRQANQQSIHHLAQAIKKRDAYPEELRRPDCQGARVYTALTDAELDRLSHETVETCKALPPERWQCITWKNVSRRALNLELQSIFNPHGQVVYEYILGSSKDYPAKQYPGVRQRGDWSFATVRLGDKVIVKKNSYSIGNNGTLDVFNGQTGIVRAYCGRHQIITIDMGTEMLELPIEDAEELFELGWCITAHKAQGSGWHAVLVFQPDAMDPKKHMPTRWWYTAATRAEEHLVIFTQLPAHTWWRNVTEPEKLPPSTLQKRIQKLLS